MCRQGTAAMQGGMLGGVGRRGCGDVPPAEVWQDSGMCYGWSLPRRSGDPTDDALTSFVFRRSKVSDSRSGLLSTSVFKLLTCLFSASDDD